MDEVLCMYYTIEMLYMLESLHRNGIIHGDFKPDNLLMRYARWSIFFASRSIRVEHPSERLLCFGRDDLAEDGFRTRSGSWHEQVSVTHI